MLFIGKEPIFTFKTNPKFCTSQATFGLNPDFCLVLNTSQTFFDDESKEFHSIKIIRKLSLKKFIGKIKENIKTDDLFVFNTKNDKEMFLKYEAKIMKPFFIKK